MIRKVCPICDQVMGASHYCKNCKSWIRSPYVRDVTYYLNERHPENERQCSYHGRGTDIAESRQESPKMSVRKEEKKTAGVNKVPVSGAASRMDGGQRTGNQSTGSDMAGWVPTDSAIAQAGNGIWNGNGINAQQNSSVMKESGRKSGSSGVVWVAITLAAVVMIASFVKAAFETVVGGFARQYGANEIFSYGEQVEPWELQWDYDSSDDDIPMFEEDDEDWWDEGGYQELTDDEAIALGKACMGDGHFSVSGEELEEAVCEILAECGYQTTSIERSSYNEAAYDEEGEVIDSYYSRYVRIVLGGEDAESVRYVELDCDTVTGKLHGISIKLQDKDEIIKMALEFVKLLEVKSGFSEGYWSEEVGRILPDKIDGAEEWYDFYTGEIEVWGYDFDNYHCIFIDAEY